MFEYVVRKGGLKEHEARWYGLHVRDGTAVEHTLYFFTGFSSSWWWPWTMSTRWYVGSASTADSSGSSCTMTTLRGWPTGTSSWKTHYLTGHLGHCSSSAISVTPRYPPRQCPLP